MTEAELKLLRAAPKGEVAVCGPNTNFSDPANDPAKAGEWGPDREIRADLIRWLCVDRDAQERVDPKGIQVYGAKITGALDLSYVTLPFGLTLWRCRLMDDANLRNVEIPGINLQGTWVSSIAADGARVKGGVFLRKGFRAEGAVRLLGAQIGTNLECDNSTFINPPQAGMDASGNALSADRAVVKGNVFLRNGFRAEGEVRLLGAQIEGDLDCEGGTFTNPPKQGMDASGNALSADGAVVKGGLFLRQGFHAEGVLNLTNASVSALVDDAASWPAHGNLILDGFLYARISGESPKGAKSRLKWLARQKDFRPQPYRQLAKVLRDDGDDSGARLVLFEMERRRRKQEDRAWPARAWSAILRATIGYGYYPGRELWGLLGLVLAGFLLFWGGYFAGSVTPTDKDAYACFSKGGQLPPHYETFHASVYSLENSFPLVKLGQADRWQPDPDPHWQYRPTKQAPRWLRLVLSPPLLRWFRWGQICLGWILATLFVAGVTGIVRKD